MGLFDEAINQYMKNKGQDPDVVAVDSVDAMMNIVASQGRRVGEVRDVPTAGEYIVKRTKAKMAEARQQGYLDLRK